MVHFQTCIDVYSIFHLRAVPANLVYLQLGIHLREVLEERLEQLDQVFGILSIRKESGQ